MSFGEVMSYTAAQFTLHFTDSLLAPQFDVASKMHADKLVASVPETNLPSPSSDLGLVQDVEFQGQLIKKLPRPKLVIHFGWDALAKLFHRSFNSTVHLSIPE